MRLGKSNRELNNRLRQLAKSSRENNLVEQLLVMKKNHLAQSNKNAKTKLGLVGSLISFLYVYKLFLLYTGMAVLSISLVTSNYFLLADTTQLYEKYLIRYENIVTPNPGARPELVAAIEAYEKAQEDPEYYADAYAYFYQIRDKDPLFRFYTAVSSMMKSMVDVNGIEKEFQDLRAEILNDKEEHYLYFLDWIDYYEVLLHFKRKELHKGKEGINALANRLELDAELRYQINRLQKQLRYLYMAK